MLELDVPVDDLNRIVQDGDPAEMLGKDGTHYTPAGYDRLADAVADCVRRQLKLRNPTVLKTPASGPDAVKAYADAETADDKLVPGRVQEHEGARVSRSTSAREPGTKHAPDVKKNVRRVAWRPAGAAREADGRISSRPRSGPASDSNGSASTTAWTASCPR